VNRDRLVSDNGPITAIGDQSGRVGRKPTQKALQDQIGRWIGVVTVLFFAW
jgi:hypothetical protein